MDITNTFDIKKDITKEETSTKPKKRAPPSLTVSCGVCSSPAPDHLHFGARCCYSCRAFFRRTVPRSEALRCRSGLAKCEINTKNKKCISCRYNKCVTIGMSPSLVRGGRKPNACDEEVVNDDLNQIQYTEENPNRDKIDDHITSVAPAPVETLDSKPRVNSVYEESKSILLNVKDCSAYKKDIIKYPPICHSPTAYRPPHHISPLSPPFHHPSQHHSLPTTSPYHPPHHLSLPLHSPYHSSQHPPPNSPPLYPPHLCLSPHRPIAKYRDYLAEYSPAQYTETQDRDALAADTYDTVALHIKHYNKITNMYPSKPTRQIQDTTNMYPSKPTRQIQDTVHQRPSVIHSVFSSKDPVKLQYEADMLKFQGSILQHTGNLFNYHANLLEKERKEKEDARTNTMQPYIKKEEPGYDDLPVKTQESIDPNPEDLADQLFSEAQDLLSNSPWILAIDPNMKQKSVPGVGTPEEEEKRNKTETLIDKIKSEPDCTNLDTITDIQFTSEELTSDISDIINCTHSEPATNISVIQRHLTETGTVIRR